VDTDTVEQDAITAMGLTEAEFTVQRVAYRDVGLFYAPDEAAVERMRVLAGVK
jgi:hypothetical protein